MPGDSRKLNLWSWALLPARTLLFAAFQSLFALGYVLAGAPRAWNAAAAWWPWTVTLTNVLCVVLLSHLYRREGARFWGLFRFDRRHLRVDLRALAGVLALTAPLAFLPNVLVAIWLFGDAQVALDLFIRPLPVWAAIAGSVLFGLTQALAELPTYFAYVMPRLAKQTRRPWLAMGLPALFLAAQHIAVPLIFDGRFVIWRLLMFFPFAVLMGLVLRRRPRLLPYLVIVHGLLDLSLAPMIIGAALR